MRYQLEIAEASQTLTPNGVKNVQKIIVGKK